MKKLSVDDLSILNIIYINFAKAGIGSGIIANGQLVIGGSNLAGELGFIPVDNGKHLRTFMESEPDDYDFIETIARVITTIDRVRKNTLLIS